MEKDRDYYRCKPDAFLIEEAKYEPGAELCIVLAERLQDALNHVAHIDDIF